MKIGEGRNKSGSNQGAKRIVLVQVIPRHVAKRISNGLVFKARQPAYS